MFDLTPSAIREWLDALPLEFRRAIEGDDAAECGEVDRSAIERLASAVEGNPVDVVRAISRHRDVFRAIGRPGRIRLIARAIAGSYSARPSVLELLVGTGKGKKRGWGSAGADVAALVREDLAAVAGVIADRVSRRVPRTTRGSRRPAGRSHRL